MTEDFDLTPLEREIRSEDIQTASAITDTLNAHRRAILAGAASMDGVEQMKREITPLLARGRELDASAGAVQSGDRSELDRYFGADGKLNLRDWTRAAFIGGDTVDLPMKGLLTDPVSRGPEHEDLRRAFANFALAGALSGKLGGQRATEALRRARSAVVMAFLRMPGRVGQWARTAFDSESSYQRAITGATGTGAELLTVPTLATIQRPIELSRRIPGLIRSAPAPSSTFKIPKVTGRALSRVSNKITADPARVQSSDFTTSDESISTVGRTIQALVDVNWLTEGGLVLTDPVGFINQWLNEGDLLTLEIAILHGDTAGTHQDTLSTWTMNGLITAGTLSESSALIKAYLGARAHAADQSALVTAGGTFDMGDHFSAMNYFGAGTGADPTSVAMIIGLNGLYSSILPMANLLTVDKAGASATILAGQIATIAGTPIVLSECMGKDFDTTTGLYTGSNKGNAAVYIRPAGWVHYEEANRADDWDVTESNRRARYIGFQRFGVLVHDGLSTQTDAVSLYNI